MDEVKTKRVNVTVACKNCQKAKKKCSDYNNNSSCESCVKRGLECKYIRPDKKRGPQIHDETLSRKYGIELNAVKELRNTFPDMSFDSIMTVLTATSKKKCLEEVNHICHEGCIIVPID
ncbi:hypothetical protein Glove_384g50 [Diversispora epigaea]|uniref:Zn(2)-C6 fungal-type domain-containing protein n=1 Tax=Diversispora epigaea TaxID=1348612 RepID=A0A397H3M6_9GLOM|nr:hypothetical protein Glove_384g50 [Diversispora epigaea]